MPLLVKKAPAQLESSDAPQNSMTAAELQHTSSTADLGHPEFSQIYNEHNRAIYYLALRFLGDPQKAEDATHDVFLKAFRKMDQFRGDASWRTWLYRIAINHCRNLLQAWHERHVLTTTDETIWDHAPAATDSPLRVL